MDSRHDPKPMLTVPTIKVRPFDDYPTGTRFGGTFTKIFAPGWELKGAFTALHVAYFAVEKKKESRSDQQIFAILNDVDQACYTSTHSWPFGAKDNIDPADSRLHPSSVDEDGFVYLTHPSEFPIQLDQFRQHLIGPENDRAWQGQLMWHGQNIVPLIIAGRGVGSNGNEISQTAVADLPVETITLVCQVDVETAADALALLPNGYFHGDLQPAQLYALLELLAERFDLEFIGAGADYFGVWREKPLSGDEARDFATVLSQLYHDANDQTRSVIEQLAVNETLFLITYTIR